MAGASTVDLGPLARDAVPAAVLERLGGARNVLAVSHENPDADTLGAVASNGPQAFTWLIFLAALFFVPYGLLTAELGSAFPEEGGPYVWTRLAFGRRVAAVDALITRLLFQKPTTALRAPVLKFLGKSTRSRLSADARRNNYDLRVRAVALILGAPHHQLR